MYGGGGKEGVEEGGDKYGFKKMQSKKHTSAPYMLCNIFLFFGVYMGIYVLGII